MSNAERVNEGSDAWRKQPGIYVDEAGRHYKESDYVIVDDGDGAYWVIRKKLRQGAFPNQHDFTVRVHPLIARNEDVSDQTKAFPERETNDTAMDLRVKEGELEDWEKKLIEMKEMEEGFLKAVQTTVATDEERLAEVEKAKGK